MRNLFLILLLISSVSIFGQRSLEEEDRIIHKMCDYLKLNAEKNDSIRVEEANAKFFYPYLDQQKESEIQQILNGVYYRYQNLCPEFMAILDKMDPLSNEEGYYVEVPEKSIISATQLAEFKKTKSFYYHFLEEMTEVKIEKGFWIENFPDGTYSKTKMDWISGSTFKLTFLESNNSMKEAFSRKGDEFIYEILKREGYFYLIQSLQSNGKYIQFKLYLN